MKVKELQSWLDRYEGESEVSARIQVFMGKFEPRVENRMKSSEYE